jgi:hypothetical protein
MAAGSAGKSKSKNKLLPRLRREEEALLASRSLFTSIGGFDTPACMETPDAFAAYHADLIEASYDCVDRLVVNCYYQLGQTGGGFRTFWRHWKGDDSRLSDQGLRQAAGDFARRLHAHCEKHGILWIECEAGDKKYEIAREHLPTDPKFRGIYAVLVGRAPAPLWEVRRNSQDQITDLRRAEQWPHVQHYYFQIIDPEWGHVVVRLCGYAPWGAQVIVNGHEWVERRARTQKIRLVKDGNCFVEGTDYKKVNRLAAKLTESDFGQRLAGLCSRWLYSACLCFALPVAEQERTGFHYQSSIWQLELSRNFLFYQEKVLEEVFQKMIDRTRAPLDIKTLETIFGRRHRQPTKKQQRAGRSGFEVAKEVDASNWDMTVWRVRWGQVVLKIYDKAGRVLRVEVKVLNTAALGCGKKVEKLGEQLSCLQGMLERFLASMQAAHVSFLDEGQFERWAEPSQRGNRRLAGLDLNKARNRAVIAAASGLATQPEGFTTAELAEAVRGRLGWTQEQYPNRRAAYDLAKLRGKGLVESVRGRRRYQCRPEQLRVLCAYVVLREQVIKPVLAGMARKELAPPPASLSALDAHYLALRAEFQRTCQTLGLAA